MNKMLCYTQIVLHLWPVYAIFTCLTVAACNPEYIIGKLDVKGTFIQAEMSGVPMYIQCQGKLKDMIPKIRPDLAKYIGKGRVLYGKMLKALYGCVQASRLWYEKLKDVLLGLEYLQSEIGVFCEYTPSIYSVCT
jgi:hypothetical protein